MAAVGKPRIERNVPIPPRGRWLDSNALRLRQAMLEMKVGHSFVWHEHSSPFRAAKELGINITTRKMNGQGYRVWRVK